MPLALPMARLTYSTVESSLAIGTRVVVNVGATRSMVAIVAATGVEVDESKKDRIKPIVEVLDGVPMVDKVAIDLAEWAASYYMARVSDIIRDGWSPLFSVEMQRLSSRFVRKKTRDKKPVVELKVPTPLSFELPDKQISLLHTGTKVDLASIVREFIAEGKHVLVLAPTPRRATAIAAQLAEYYTVALYSSTTTVNKRAYLATRCATDISPQVIVGTRLSIWLNHKNLAGIVITDEESFYYRSGKSPFISARECALMLAVKQGVRCLLVSSFPSTESYYNGRYGSWGYKYLPIENDTLKSIVLERGRVDMVSAYTKEKIAEALGGGNRAVVLQNRRGVASYIECERCGYIPYCPNCSTSLTLHREVMGCHYCGHREAIPEKCPECEAKMENRGRGTQQFEEQMATYYPDAVVARLDSDSIFDQNSNSQEVLSGTEKSWDILIGTTLLLDADVWRNISVVAVLNVDNMLSAADFRVEENAYRTLGMLANHCRENDAELIIQSSRLDHRIFSAVLKGEVEEFYSTQIVEREVPKFPPHSRMIRIALKASELKVATSSARKLEGELRQIFGSRLSPLYQPIVERQRGEFIVEMTIKIERGRSVARAKEILQQKLKKEYQLLGKLGVSVEVEVDPL